MNKQLREEAEKMRKVRLNQPRVTAEQARAQAQRVERESARMRANREAPPTPEDRAGVVLTSEQGEDGGAPRMSRKEAIAALAQCCRLTGADPDGNEDWRLAPLAVSEVQRMRDELEELELHECPEE